MGVALDAVAAGPGARGRDAGASGPCGPGLRCLSPSQPPSATQPRPACAGCETEGARLLRDICARLPDPDAIPALFEALAGTGNASVSTFELLSSGCLRALKAYLQVGGTKVASAAELRMQVPGNLHLLLHALPKHV